MMTRLGLIALGVALLAVLAAKAQISPFSSPGNTLNGGLVGWWKLGEGGSGPALDSSGNGNNGTWNGTAAGTNGYYSAGGNRAWAGTFNGSNDYVDLGTPSVLNISSTITIAARFLVTAISGNPDIVSKGYNGTTTPYYIGFGNYGAPTTSLLCGSFYGGGTTGAFTSRDFSLAANQGKWFDVVCTYDGVSWRIWINGVADWFQYNKSQSLYSSTGTHVYIGAVANSGTPAEFFDGLLGDVMIWNRALSANEARQFHHSQPAVGAPPWQPTTFYDSNWWILGGTIWQYETVQDIGCFEPAVASVSGNVLSISANYVPGTVFTCSGITTRGAGSHAGMVPKIVQTNSEEGLIFTVPSFLYGTFEVSQKLGVNTNIGAWMEGATVAPAQPWWPGYTSSYGYSEVDLGLGDFNNTNVQIGVYPAGVGEAYEIQPAVSNPAGRFHQYKLVWTSTGLTWYIDGTKVGSYATTAFQVPMLLNLSCLLEGVGNTSFTSETLQVQYVRICNSGGTLVFDEEWGGTPADGC